MRRIFIAIDISMEARQCVADHISRLLVSQAETRAVASVSAYIKWIPAEKLHLTIKFIGNTDETQLEKIKKAVEKVSRQFTNFSLSLRGVGVFPSRSRARVLWIGIEDEERRCSQINESFEKELGGLAFDADKDARFPKAFAPHLTIARVKDPRGGVGRSLKITSHRILSRSNSM